MGNFVYNHYIRVMWGDVDIIDSSWNNSDLMRRRKSQTYNVFEDYYLYRPFLF